MMRSERKSAGPTSTAASVMSRQRGSPESVSPGCASSQSSIFLWAFSIITIAASTIAPTAIVMPPRLIRFALMPWKCIAMKARQSPSGSVMIATRALRTCQRKSAQTSATTVNSSRSLPERVWIAWSISVLRS